jgi:hypothetical protein
MDGCHVLQDGFLAKHCRLGEVLVARCAAAQNDRAGAWAGRIVESSDDGACAGRGTDSGIHFIEAIKDRQNPPIADQGVSDIRGHPVNGGEMAADPGVEVGG